MCCHAEQKTRKSDNLKIVQAKQYMNEQQFVNILYYILLNIAISLFLY